NKFVVPRTTRRRLVQNAAQNFMDDSGRDGDQNDVTADLLPFVALVIGQARNQAAVEVLGDAGRQRFAASQVLGDARRQGGGRTDQLPILAEDDAYLADIHGRAAQVDLHAAIVAARLAFAGRWIGQRR